MVDHVVRFEGVKEGVIVPTGTLLSEAAKLAGIEIQQPCGGQGRCGRCTVQVKSGSVRRRSTLRLSAEDIDKGYALSCQTVVEGDVDVVVPPQEKIIRKLIADQTALKVTLPDGYEPAVSQTVHRVNLDLAPPSLEDQTDDVSRLRVALRQKLDIRNIQISLSLLRKMGSVLRGSDWKINVILDVSNNGSSKNEARIIDIQPGLITSEEPLLGAAIDIGTTTVSLWLVDLLSGEVIAKAAEYNAQISRGEDVISRIVYSSKGSGKEELRELIVGTINELIEKVHKRIKSEKNKIVKAVVTGNSTMMHLFLGIPAESIRLEPFVTALNNVPELVGKETQLNIHQEGTIHCLPGVASYVGADISCGVLSSRISETDKLSLFMDIGTNGEIVLGSGEWLVTCACSAGPAFEGSGVLHGMRATKGAIEEIWINTETYEPTYRVIGGNKPTGICGSGLLSLLAEMFVTGIVDKRGNIKSKLDTKRVREGDHGLEYVIVWNEDSEIDEDIVITRIDIDNLIRAKAAVYAGFTVLANRVGISLENVEEILIGGSFGKYINVEKAIEIGLLPDMPLEQFSFLGNTAILGAYYALIDNNLKDEIDEIASRMTYVELSADNTFYEAFTSALFLPHTDITKFPTVAEAMKQE